MIYLIHFIVVNLNFNYFKSDDEGTDDEEEGEDNENEDNEDELNESNKENYEEELAKTIENVLTL